VADAENGIGDDLGFWSNHISKFTLIHEFDSSYTASTSLVHYWGFPGTEDLNNWVTDNAGGALSGKNYQRYGVYDGTNDRAFGSSTFWNAGLQKTFGKELSVRVNLYNMMGLLDKSHNKRNFATWNAGSYMTDPFSIAISFEYNL
jgi:hypothetical protein